MFQTALDLRERFVTGWTPRPSGVGSEKPWMPCLNGRLPVAIEVQSIGESGGCSVAMCPIAPCFTSRWTLGIFPASISGWIDFPVGGVPADQQHLFAGTHRAQFNPQNRLGPSRLPGFSAFARSPHRPNQSPARPTPPSPAQARR